MWWIMKINLLQETKNETYETWISNISNLDKVDESKDTVVTNNCIKINADKENNRDAKY